MVVVELAHLVLDAVLQHTALHLHNVAALSLDAPDILVSLLLHLRLRLTETHQFFLIYAKLLVVEHGIGKPSLGPELRHPLRSSDVTLQAAQIPLSASSSLTSCCSCCLAVATFSRSVDIFSADK